MNNVRQLDLKTIVAGARVSNFESGGKNFYRTTEEEKIAKQKIRLKSIQISIANHKLRW